MEQKEILNQIISYGVQNKKKKDEIFNAILKTGKFDVTTAATSLKQIGDLGVFDYEQNGTNPGGAQVTAGVAQDLGDSKAAQEMISSLESGIQSAGGKKAYSPVAGQLRAYNPWDTDVQTIQSQINATKQIVGKYLEGGVLRMEDEKKYEKILPKIGDTPEVAKAKIEQVKKLIEEKYNAQTQTLGQAGFDISGFQQETVPGFQEAMDFARQNPNDPKSQQLIQAVRSGQVDPITGQKKTEINQSPTGNPIDQTTTPPPLKTEEKSPDNILSRGWEATKEVIPGLVGDIGNRIKNIGGNIKERMTESKDNSIFENVMRGFETNFRNLGEVGGTVGDVASRALELAYKTGVPKEAQDKIKKTATEFIQTETGQKAMSALQGGAEVWSKFKEANPNVAKDMEASFNIITAIPAGKGLGVVGNEAKALSSDVVEGVARTVGKDAVTEASNKVFKAVKPSITVDRNKSTIRAVLDEANNEIVDRGFKPRNLKEYAQHLSETRKQVWSEIEEKIGASDGLKVDLKPIAGELEKMATDANLLRVDKGVAGKIKKMAENLLSQGGEISVSDAEALKQFVNAELKGAFGKFNLSNVEQNARKTITKKIGEQLDSLLSDLPGEFKGLKNKYGSLRQVEDDVLKRIVVFDRQNPQGLIDSFSKVSGIGKIIKAFVPGGGGVSSFAQGVGEVGMGYLQKKANSADELVKKAFEKLSQRRGSFQPKSKTFNAVKKIRPGMNIQAVDEAIKQTEENIRNLKSRGLPESSSQVKKLIKELDNLRKK